VPHVQASPQQQPDRFGSQAQGSGQVQSSMMALLGVLIRSADGAALRFITALSAFLPSKAREAPVL